MVELTAGGEGESYEEIAKRVTADLGSKALPNVVEVRFGYVGDAGDFLANPQHIRVLNGLFEEQVPPFRIVEAQFKPGSSLTDTTISLRVVGQ